ncbi:DUF4386 domain-containing protein [Rugamonas sp. CCM 8940]|uniref:DUF4386 domain-containing protein n=1 Tax=Rugamonas sp. CCM 8940 TaxID=2765359 RepID=UPI0018F48470|nr:DUF4386 domain-containing protein [Rugamonas sp. CCM 8940]MBJ7312841.1 DUF4386 domain-containing protein [Rugamonas sp. CCM 8940]
MNQVLPSSNAASTLSKNARIAGLIYLLLILIAPFRLIYLPGKLFVDGDTAATIHNIASHAALFRLGIMSDMLTAAVSLFLTFLLYRLFKDVHKGAALLMLMLGFMDTPMYVFNVLNDVAALILVQGADLLSAFNQAQRDGLTMLFLRIHGQMTYAAEIFWGLWLFPLAYLVFRSAYLPRFIGVWLIVNGVAYLGLSFSGLLWPQYAETVANLAFPCQLGEVAFTLWLLIMGARTARLATPLPQAA